MAASTLYRSQTPLGDYFRRIKSRAGAGKAVVATARNMAVIYYHMIKNKSAFSPEKVNKANTKYKEDKIKRLERQLEKLRAA